MPVGHAIALCAVHTKAAVARMWVDVRLKHLCSGKGICTPYDYLKVWEALADAIVAQANDNSYFTSGMNNTILRDVNTITTNYSSQYSYNTTNTFCILKSAKF